MGTFDYVNVKLPCPKCGKELNDFQSKDGPCFLELIEPDYVYRFYTICSCKAWVEYSRDPEIKMSKSAPPADLERVHALGFAYKEPTDGK